EAGLEEDDLRIEIGVDVGRCDIAELPAADVETGAFLEGVGEGIAGQRANLVIDGLNRGVDVCPRGLSAAGVLNLDDERGADRRLALRGAVLRPLTDEGAPRAGCRAQHS